MPGVTGSGGRRDQPKGDTEIIFVLSFAVRQSIIFLPTRRSIDDVVAKTARAERP